MPKNLYVEEILLKILDCLSEIKDNMHSNDLYHGMKNSMVNNDKDPWIPLSKWNKNFDYPSKGAMQGIALRRKENGANEFFRKINNRLYINVHGFHKWIEKNTQYTKQPYLENK